MVPTANAARSGPPRYETAAGQGQPSTFNHKANRRHDTQGTSGSQKLGVVVASVSGMSQQPSGHNEGSEFQFCACLRVGFSSMIRNSFGRGMD